MFNLSGSEIVVILLLALVVLGPEKLPDAIRRAGRTYAELKKMGNSFQSEMRSVLDEPMQEMRETADLLRQSVDFTEGEITGTKTPRAPHPPKASTNGASTDDPRGTPEHAASEHGRATDSSDTAAEATDQPTGAGTEMVAISPPDDPDEALINRTLSGGE